MWLPPLVLVGEGGGKEASAYLKIKHADQRHERAGSAEASQLENAVIRQCCVNLLSNARHVLEGLLLFPLSHLAARNMLAGRIIAQPAVTPIGP